MKGKETNLLHNVAVSRTRATNADSNVVGGKELLRNLAHVLVEGRREQHVLMITILVSV